MAKQAVWLPTVSNEVLRPYSLSEYAYQIYLLLIHDEHQGRKNPKLHPTLCQVALDRCMDMWQREYFGHTNPDGEGPNQLVETAGYNLPDWYDQSKDSNNVESIALNYPKPELAYAALLNSPSHRPHMLGEGFYAQQINLGIATAGKMVNDKTVAPYYYCILSAPLF